LTESFDIWPKVRFVNNFDFWPKCFLFGRNFYFRQCSDFWPKFRFLTKVRFVSISIFERNFAKFRFLNKKFDFWPKCFFLFDRKFYFTATFRFLTKILGFGQNFVLWPISIFEHQVWLLTKMFLFWPTKFRFLKQNFIFCKSKFRFFWKRDYWVFSRSL